MKTEVKKDVEKDKMENVKPKSNIGKNNEGSKNVVTSNQETIVITKNSENLNKIGNW